MHSKRDVTKNYQNDVNLGAEFGSNPSAFPMMYSLVAFLLVNLDRETGLFFVSNFGSIYVVLVVTSSVCTFPPLA